MKTEGKIKKKEKYFQMNAAAASFVPSSVLLQELSVTTQANTNGKTGVQNINVVLQKATPNAEIISLTTAVPARSNVGTNAPKDSL